MKKLFAAIVVLAMLATTFAVVSYANVAFQVDGAYLTNDSDPKSTHAQPWIANESEKDVAAGANAGDIGSVYELGYSYFHIQGWLGDDTDDYSDIGYQINDGEILWGQMIPEDGLAAAAGWKYCARYNVTIPLQEGSVAINFYKKVGSAETVVKTISYVNAAPTGESFDRKSIGTNSGDPGKAIWLNEKGEYTAVKFTTTGEIGGLEFFFWASNPDTGTGPRGTVKVEMFAFDSNFDTTVGKTPVFTKNFDWNGDNNPAFAMEFDEKLAAGTYILKVTIIDDNATAVDNETSYIVFPDATGDIDTAKFTFYNNVGKDGAKDDSKVTNITLLGPDNIAEADYFAANPADTVPGGSDTPATGDNTVVIFALVAVIALAATLFIKKKAF